MEFVEATAYYLQAGIENNEDKIVIQCMIDPDRRIIVRGDWMGYQCLYGFAMLQHNF